MQTAGRLADRARGLQAAEAGRRRRPGLPAPAACLQLPACPAAGRHRDVITALRPRRLHGDAGASGRRDTRLPRPHPRPLKRPADRQQSPGGGVPPGLRQPPDLQKRPWLLKGREEQRETPRGMPAAAPTPAPLPHTGQQQALAFTPVHKRNRVMVIKV